MSEPELRGRILEKAAGLFTERGYRGVSMREIAEAARVSKAGLYYHFRDKEALFLAVVLGTLDALGRRVAEVRAEEGSAREQLRRLLGAVSTHLSGQQALIRMAEQDARHLSEVAQGELYRAYREQFTGQVEAMLSAGQQSGELRAFDAPTATRLFLGLAYPLLSTPPEEAPATTALLLELFFEGATRQD